MCIDAREVQRYQHCVFTLSVQILLDDDAASERTQETFLAAWRGLPSFRGEVRFSTWLYRIALTSCVSATGKTHAGERAAREKADGPEA
ncbi:sigma factor [Ktedonobacter sp. SOSP1-52]|uniref:sigma factor n=1 Tax=Ktedonobacter sp. SOSP1-52 TaxID=2778366 RepID=UPI0021074810|nr:sigma factor [Ktedonobacter sp. SOSP1-52]